MTVPDRGRLRPEIWPGATPTHHDQRPHAFAAAALPTLARPAAGSGSSTACCLLTTLHLAFQQHEVVHQLLHAGAGLRGELLSRRIVHRRGGAAELVGAPRQRTRFAQHRRDRLRRRRPRPVHIVVAHAADCAVHHKPDRAANPECRKPIRFRHAGRLRSPACASTAGPRRLTREARVHPECPTREPHRRRAERPTGGSPRAPARSSATPSATR